MERREVLFHEIKQYALTLQSCLQSLETAIKEETPPVSEFRPQPYHADSHTHLEKKVKIQEALIDALREEISYLKEINYSQRVMMEDNLDYLRSLEEKLMRMES
jgi:hypothetical protein